MGKPQSAPVVVGAVVDEVAIIQTDGAVVQENGPAVLVVPFSAAGPSVGESDVLDDSGFVETLAEHDAALVLAVDDHLVRVIAHADDGHS